MEELRRRPTFSHQMSVNRSNVWDLAIKPTDDDSDEKKITSTGSPPEQASPTTVRTILHDREDEIPAGETTFPPGRTLLDIIGSEESSSAATYKGMIDNHHPRINWKSFKNRLSLRRNESGPSVSSDFMASCLPVPGGNSPRGAIVTEYDDDAQVGEAQGPAQSAAAAGVVVEEADPPAQPASQAQQPVMSLMALLQAEGETIDMGDEEEADYDEEEDEEEGTGEYVCCVCMVRHKGAAFIPCGHTFCRLCSRELWVSRGNCPLCNGYILEILDIF